MFNDNNMKMEIHSNCHISEIQHGFNKAYPYLKLDFYRVLEPGFARRHLKTTSTLKEAGLKVTGDIEIKDTMTVGELERAFKEKFGLQVQVSRKSGILWLETTITDKWTLKQQNDHGRELSQHDRKEIPDQGLLDAD
jgi:hypothetical protein